MRSLSAVAAVSGTAQLFQGQVTVEAVNDGWVAAPQRVRVSFHDARAWLTPDEAREFGIALIAAAEELRLS